MSIRTRAAKITAAVTLSLAALGIGASASPAGAVAGDPSQWGQSTAAAASQRSVTGDPSQWVVQKVNEYEGQHR